VLELKETGDWIIMVAIAAVLGAIGGLAFELLQSRYGETGSIQLPRSRGRGRYLDLGVWANVIVGAIAAVAALAIFPPEVERIVVQDNTTTTTLEYKLTQILSLSLVIGSAGSAFLSAFQARLLAMLKDQEAETTRRIAEGELNDLETAMSGPATNERLAGRIEAAKSAVQMSAVGRSGE
jgi:hypothetical protein